MPNEPNPAAPNPAAPNRSRPHTFVGKPEDATPMDCRKTWTTSKVEVIVLGADVSEDLRCKRQGALEERDVPKPIFFRTLLKTMDDRAGP